MVSIRVDSIEVASEAIAQPPVTSFDKPAQVNAAYSELILRSLGAKVQQPCQKDQWHSRGRLFQRILYVSGS